MENKRTWKVGDKIRYIDHVWVITKECNYSDNAWIIAYPKTLVEFGWIREDSTFVTKLTPLEQLL